LKIFSEDIVFIVRDNKIGSYYLDLGYFKKSVESGFSFQESDNFVSVETFTNSKDMLEYLESFEDEKFNFSMALDPMASEIVIEKYFKDVE